MPPEPKTSEIGVAIWHKIRSFITSLFRHWIEIVFTLTGIVMLVGLMLMLGGVTKIMHDLNELRTVATEAQSKADNAEIVQQKLLQNSELNREQWELLHQHNPEIAVPQIVEEPTPEPTKAKRGPEIVVEPVKLRPTPTPKIIKVVPHKHDRPKRTPSPRPWYDYFRRTR